MTTLAFDPAALPGRPTTEPAQPAAKTALAPVQAAPSSALAVYAPDSTEAALAEWAATDDLLDGMDHLGVATPYLVITQNSTKIVSQHGLTPGHFIYTPTLEQYDAVDAIIVGTLFQRVMSRKYNPNAEQQERPICRSLDGVHGTGSSEFDATTKDKFVTLSNDKTREAPLHIEAGRVCADCPFAAWGKGKGDKPGCGEHYVNLLYLPDLGLPAVFDVRSTAIKPFRTLRNVWAPRSMVYAGDIKKQHGITIPARLAAVVPMTLKEERPPGKAAYFVPVFGAVKPSSLESIGKVAEMKSLFDDIRKDLVTRGVEQVAEPDDPSDGNSDAQQHSAPSGGAWSTRFAAPPAGDPMAR